MPAFIRGSGRHVMILGVLAIFASPAFSVPAPPPDDSAGEIERLERELVEAIGRKDLAVYDRIVADAYVAFEASGKETPKTEIMASYRSGARGYTGLEIFGVHARVFGDTAVVSARTKGFRREDGRNIPNEVSYIRVFARRDGHWRAVAQKSAPLPVRSP